MIRSYESPSLMRKQQGIAEQGEWLSLKKLLLRTWFYLVSSTQLRALYALESFLKNMYSGEAI